MGTRRVRREEGGGERVHINFSTFYRKFALLMEMLKLLVLSGINVTCSYSCYLETFKLLMLLGKSTQKDYTL